MTLGEKLVNLRKQHNKMTQEELAEKLGITRQTIFNWESNQTKPDLDQLKGLSKLYKISIDELVDNEIKDILTERVSNVEKLAGLIYKILKGLVIAVLGLIIAFILSIIFNKSYPVSVGLVTNLNCTLNNRDYAIEIHSNKNQEIVNIVGAAELYNNLNLSNLQKSNQAIEKINDCMT